MPLTPALAQASVGIAMGIAGSDVALETADIVLVADRLEKLSHAIRLGRRSQVIVKQNIAIALGSVFLLLIANFVGNITINTSDSFRQQWSRNYKGLRSWDEI